MTDTTTDGETVSVHGSEGAVSDDSSERTVEVHERKFNGTATLRILATNKDRAKAAAREYFRDTHGSKPSKVIAEEDSHLYLGEGEKTPFTVMVADHSSGSLCDSDEYTF